jgi:hypothetical protein
MPAVSIACIVEGQGEVQAMPILLRRLVSLINPAVYADVQRPIRQAGTHLLNAGGIETAVELAVRGLREPGIVLIVIDSDDICPKEVAPKLLVRAERSAAGRRPVSVVLAHREFECWFIAAAESIAGCAGLRTDLKSPESPESIRGAKEWLRKNMLSCRAYSETIDQPSLANKFDLNAARRAPSFDKMYREVERLCALAVAV